jgi:PPM family protein phosphatase
VDTKAMAGDHRTGRQRVPDGPWGKALSTTHPIPVRSGPTTPRLVFSAAAVSLTGPRVDNQDSGLAGPELLAVADGVGGKVGGAAASALVVTSLVEQLPLSWDGDPEALLRRAVVTANRRLGDVCSEVPVLAGMATTLTSVGLSVGGHVVVAHVGDSRAYLLRGGQLVALTRDHSVVQAMLDAASISAEQARDHPLRSLLLAALRGREDDTEGAEVLSVQVGPGDRLLLCSDGLWGVSSADHIRRVLVEEVDASAAALRLSRNALAAPATDNITVVVGDVTLPADGIPGVTVVGAAAAPDQWPQRAPADAAARSALGTAAHGQRQTREGRCTPCAEQGSTGRRMSLAWRSLAGPPSTSSQHLRTIVGNHRETNMPIPTEVDPDHRKSQVGPPSPAAGRGT